MPRGRPKGSKNKEEISQETEKSDEPKEDSF